uniref:Uncharacterized protein n=1 Tax=Grammatophora oceanica TaxID=210454 RepID=A0A7S1VV91_9STRA|mmetsp:Transcript_9253/g.13529  ORF Transcript_9253/g.13529 Transcript_9253/m.13529 type:complete len:144 (+) Transcript_9253:900-1331(+)
MATSTDVIRSSSKTASNVPHSLHGSEWRERNKQELQKAVYSILKRLVENYSSQPHNFDSKASRKASCSQGCSFVDISKQQVSNKNPKGQSFLPFSLPMVHANQHDLVFVPDMPALAASSRRFKMDVPLLLHHLLQRPLRPFLL